ncbi:reverse transcriptase domain-containing protein [Tanacetum coccineum]|uniref:Reverse transcriptase domain-containing protein n=1 Tax=Tanacetum coccineum TaxID=301880 RepID=A0ABQ5A4R5_9ASTR
MAPKRATRSTPVTENPTTTTVTNAQLQAMIDQGVTAALTARDANRNGDDSHTSGTGARRTERVTRECTYQDFMKCQPLYFKGTEGVVELTQWFERMETVFRISNCSVENQIKFSTCTLLAGALTWRQETARAYAAVPAEGKVYAGNLPSQSCNFHIVACPPKCQKCQKAGHLEKDCRVRPPGAGVYPYQDVTCHGCGEKGHFKNRCPKAGNQQNVGARARAYAVVKIRCKFQCGRGYASFLIITTLLFSLILVLKRVLYLLRLHLSSILPQLL